MVFQPIDFFLAVETSYFCKAFKFGSDVLTMKRKKCKNKLNQVKAIILIIFCLYKALWNPILEEANYSLHNIYCDE